MDWTQKRKPPLGKVDHKDQEGKKSVTRDLNLGASVASRSLTREEGKMNRERNYKRFCAGQKWSYVVYSEKKGRQRDLTKPCWCRRLKKGRGELQFRQDGESKKKLKIA